MSADHDVEAAFQVVCDLMLDGMGSEDMEIRLRTMADLSEILGGAVALFCRDTGAPVEEWLEAAFRKVRAASQGVAYNLENDPEPQKGYVQ